MENTEQQPPQVISLADIANRGNEQPIVTPIEPVELIQPSQPVAQVQAPLEEVKTASRYSNQIKNLISDGFLENISVTIDGQEVFLEEADIKDEDTYKSILESIKAEQDRERKEKYISKDGLDDTFLKVIETRKAGGNVDSILREDIKAIDQLSNLKNILDNDDVEDKEKERLAINIVAQNLQQKGLSQKVIQAQIEDFIETGNLETEANAILDVSLNSYSQEIENKRQYELQKAEKEREDLKTFKKTISSKVKDFGIPEAMQKVIVENTTKLDELRISNTDKLYFDIQQNNPDLFAEVVFFINNPTAYKEWSSGKSVTRAKAEIIRPSIVINTNKKKEVSSRSLNSLEEIATRQ